MYVFHMNFRSISRIFFLAIFHNNNACTAVFVVLCKSVSNDARIFNIDFLISGIFYLNKRLILVLPRFRRYRPAFDNQFIT